MNGKYALKISISITRHAYLNIQSFPVCFEYAYLELKMFLNYFQDDAKWS